MKKLKRHSIEHELSIKNIVIEAIQKHLELNKIISENDFGKS